MKERYHIYTDGKELGKGTASVQHKIDMGKGGGVRDHFKDQIRKAVFSFFFLNWLHLSAACMELIGDVMFISWFLL